MTLWLVFLGGVIVGGILFNAKMRKGAMRILSGLLGEKTKKEKGNMVAMVGKKKYRLVPEDEEEE